jgi:hypothetical protein
MMVYSIITSKPVLIDVSLKVNHHNGLFTYQVKTCADQCVCGGEFHRDDVFIHPIEICADR